MGRPPGTGRLGTSGHFCPSATLPLRPWFNYGGPAQPCPRSPPLHAAQRGGGLHPLPAAAPQRALPVRWWLFPPNTSARSPGSHHQILPPAGVFRFTPFHSYLPPHPCNVKVKLGCPARLAGCCPGVTAWLGGAEHAAPGVRVLLCLGAVRISTASATPALFRCGVNRFCTGTSSCYYWELEDWNNPRVRRGESVPSGQVLSSSRTGVRNKCLLFLLRGTRCSLPSVLLGKGWVMLPGFGHSAPA